MQNKQKNLFNLYFEVQSKRSFDAMTHGTFDTCILDEK